MKIDVYKFEKLVNGYLKSAVSYYDSTEAFYHGLMLGLLALTGGFYTVKSNRESGFGRFDIALFPVMENYPGYVFEFKVAEAGESLETKAEEALSQIIEKDYALELKAAGVGEIKIIGMSFRGKEAVIKRRS